MLNIDYLREPSFARRLVYRYRSGTLKGAMRSTVEKVGAPLGHPLVDHSDSNFVVGLDGFFQGTHFADFGASRLGTIEAAMRAMFRYQARPVAIFVPASSKVFATATWAELEQTALVIEEPLATAENLDRIIDFALATSDLSPPADLVDDADLRSFLLDRTKLSPRLGDILLDVDDYILTRLGAEDVRSPVDVDVRETALNRAVARYIGDPGPVERRGVLTQALLRGDNERLMTGALTSATATYLRRLIKSLDGAAFGTEHETALAWSYALLLTLAKVAALDETYHPSWRGAPDLRTLVVLDLCARFRRYLNGDAIDDLLHETREAIRRIPVLPASDEAAFDYLKEAIGGLCANFDQLPAPFNELRLLLANRLLAETIPARFTGRLADIVDQPIAVEHLRQRIRSGTQDGAILLHGPASGGVEGLSSAFAQALLCQNPFEGDRCGNCTSCLEVVKQSSPYMIQVLLSGDAKVSAEGQVQQVRTAVRSRGHWPGKRAVVIVGADRVRKGAIDGLLKTVEEAPSLTSFIFVAERIREVPVALRSRCLCIPIKRPLMSE